MKPWIGCLIVLTLSGCTPQPEQASTHQTPSEWVFVHFNVLELERPKSYFYYAKVSRERLATLTTPEGSRGFIRLHDVKYWDDQQRIQNYRDGENSGELVFNLKDLVRLSVVHQAPVAGLGYEQFQSSFDASLAQSP